MMHWIFELYIIVILSIGFILYAFFNELYKKFISIWLDKILQDDERTRKFILFILCLAGIYISIVIFSLPYFSKTPPNPSATIALATWKDPAAGIEFRQVPDGDFWIGRVPVTTKQYKSFFTRTHFTAADSQQSVGCADVLTPTNFSQPDERPAVCVSWMEAVGFAKWLTKKNNKGTYTLPTDAEWSSACSNDVLDVLGNVLEWCEDKYHPDVKDDPTHVVKGGSWNRRFEKCQDRETAYAKERKEDLGFRLIWRP